jgi:hypothetical protein
MAFLCGLMCPVSKLATWPLMCWARACAGCGPIGEPDGQLIELLPQQPQLNTDETGHKNNGKRYWIRCFRAASFVVFKIDPSRGTEVLLRMLGQDCKEILECDYYGAYRKYARQRSGHGHPTPPRQRTGRGPPPRGERTVFRRGCGGTNWPSPPPGRRCWL